MLQEEATGALTPSPTLWVEDEDEVEVSKIGFQRRDGGFGSGELSQACGIVVVEWIT